MKQISVPGIGCCCYKKLGHVALALGLQSGWKSPEEAVSENLTGPRRLSAESKRFLKTLCQWESNGKWGKCYWQLEGRWACYMEVWSLVALSPATQLRTGQGRKIPLEAFSISVSSLTALMPHWDRKPKPAHAERLYGEMRRLHE